MFVHSSISEAKLIIIFSGFFFNHFRFCQILIVFPLTIIQAVDSSVVEQLLKVMSVSN